MTHLPNDRRGAALASVLFAITVLMVIGAVALTIGTQESRIGDNSRYSVRAFNAAEAGLAEQLAAWKTNDFDTLSVGDSTTVPSTSASGGGYYTGTVRRLSGAVFVMTMTGTERQSNSGTQARIGRVVVLRPLAVSVKGALTTAGSVKVGGTSTISGVSTAPPGWLNCGLASSVPGIATPNASGVSVNGSATVTGSTPTPSVVTDTTIGSSTFNNFGSTTYSSLAANADIQLAAGTYNGIGPVFNANGSCNTTNTSNWGDAATPTSTCASYFPVIHLAGGSTVNGGEGQGILLVDGDLKLTGGFTFVGIIITQGTFDASGNGGNGATVFGAVMAADASLSTDQITGAAQIQYSACATQAALAGAATVSPVTRRGWFAM